MWTASLHGAVDHLEADVAKEAEQFVADVLAELVGKLVERGHQGVAGQFHPSTGAPTNLMGPGPGPSTPVEAQGPGGEIAAGQMADVVKPGDGAT